MGNYNTDTIILYCAGIAVFIILIVIIVLANNNDNNDDNNNNNNNNNNTSSIDDINEKTRDLENDSVTFSSTLGDTDGLASVEDYSVYR